MSVIEALRIRTLVCVTWRLSNERLRRSLRNFAATEKDSAWHLADALSRSGDPRVKAGLFGQVLEEMRHADEFTRLARRLSPAPYAPVKMERKPLYPDPRDHWKFFAHCHVGEHAAATRFKHIHDALPDGELKRVLKQILRDEAHHVHDAGELMASTGRNARELARAERGVKFRRAREAWMRAGRQVTDVVASAILAVTYVLVGAIGARAARRQLFGGHVPTKTRRPVGSPARLEVQDAHPRA